jgi:hypothetical protein
MDANTFILGFSLVIFLAGVVAFVLISREFTKMSETHFEGGEEGGPRAALFDKLYAFFSETEGSSPEEKASRKEEIKKLLKELDRGM